MEEVVTCLHCSGSGRLVTEKKVTCYGGCPCRGVCNADSCDGTFVVRKKTACPQCDGLGFMRVVKSPVVVRKAGNGIRKVKAANGCRVLDI